jgi:hypothetical protein
MSHNLIDDFKLVCREGNYDSVLDIINRDAIFGKGQRWCGLLEIAYIEKASEDIIELLCKCGYKITHNGILTQNYRANIMKLLLIYNALDSNIVFKYNGHRVNLLNYIAT